MARTMASGLLRINWPGVRQKCDDGYAANREVLLVAQVCVRRQHHVKTFELRRCQQITVANSRQPADRRTRPRGGAEDATQASEH